MGRVSLLLVLGVAALGAAAVPQAAQAATWCGIGPTAADRLPDAARGGRQIHLVYAYPADAAPDLAEASVRLVAEAQAMDAWWRREDPGRTLRFDRFRLPAASSRSAISTSRTSSCRGPAPTTWPASRR